MKLCLTRSIRTSILASVKAEASRKAKNERCRLHYNGKGQARVEWLDEAIYNVRVALTRSALR